MPIGPIPISPVSGGPDHVGSRTGGAGNSGSAARPFATFLTTAAAGRGCDVLSDLRERFPAAAIRKGQVPPGLEAARKFFAAADPAVDQVVLHPEVVTALHEDDRLADTVDGVLQAVLSDDPVRRRTVGIRVTVIITITEVRVGETVRDSESGAVVAAGELRFRLDALFSELLRRLFGHGEEEETAAADFPDDGGIAAGQGSRQAGLALWFFSPADPAAGLGALSWWYEFSFSLSYFAAAGNGAGDTGGVATLLAASHIFHGLAAVPAALAGAADAGGDAPSGASLLALIEATLQPLGVTGDGLCLRGDECLVRLRSDSLAVTPDLSEQPWLPGGAFVPGAAALPAGASLFAPTGAVPSLS